MSTEKEIEVVVPDLSFRFTKEQAVYWAAMGDLIDSAKANIGDSMGWSMIASRFSRELRREFGNEGAKEFLKGMIDTMDEASKYDAH